MRDVARNILLSSLLSVLRWAGACDIVVLLFSQFILRSFLFQFLFLSFTLSFSCSMFCSSSFSLFFHHFWYVHTVQPMCIGSMCLEDDGKWNFRQKNIVFVAHTQIEMMHHNIICTTIFFSFIIIISFLLFTFCLLTLIHLSFSLCSLSSLFRSFLSDSSLLLMCFYSLLSSSFQFLFWFSTIVWVYGTHRKNTQNGNESDWMGSQKKCKCVLWFPCDADDDEQIPAKAPLIVAIAGFKRGSNQKHTRTIL